MWLSVVVLVLCGCGAAPQVAVTNRGGATTASCPFKAQFELQGRRYGNVDADDADFQKWTPWQIRVVFASELDLHGTIEMHGDKLDWKFPIAGALDRAHCVLTLRTDTHEAIGFTIRFADTVTGEAHSIDDVWLLGPPFPPRR